MARLLDLLERRVPVDQVEADGDQVRDRLEVPRAQLLDASLDVLVALRRGRRRSPT
jgi:hypothetical protein